MVSNKWSELDTYEKAGVCMNYFSALILLILGGMLYRGTDYLGCLDYKKRSYVMLILGVLITLGNIPYVIKV